MLGVRGDGSFLDQSQMHWVEAEREEDSTKPEIIRGLIERVSPPPRLELFARMGKDYLALRAFLRDNPSYNMTV